MRPKLWSLNCAAVVQLLLVAQSSLAGPLVLHPKAKPLPTTQQDPFITAGDGGILCVDSQNAWHSADEGITWKSYPPFEIK